MSTPQPGNPPFDKQAAASAQTKPPPQNPKPAANDPLASSAPRSVNLSSEPPVGGFYLKKAHKRKGQKNG